MGTRDEVPPHSEWEPSLRARELEILAAARQWGLAADLGSDAGDFHLLSMLQHHGVPTRLLDVTSNPFTALWFASEHIAAGHGHDRQGLLLAIDVTGLEQHETIDQRHTWGHLENPLGASLEQALEASADSGQPFLLRPSLPDDRMRAQEGLFLAGAAPHDVEVAGVDDVPLPLAGAQPPGAEALGRLFDPSERSQGAPMRLPFVALIVPARVKAQMRRYLESTYNRTRRVLFPDVAGFAEGLRLREF